MRTVLRVHPKLIIILTVCQIIKVIYSIAFCKGIFLSARFGFIVKTIRILFFSLAGTSAGWIYAMLFAGLGDVSKPISGKVIEVLGNKNFYDFVDGDSHSKAFIKALLEKSKKIKLFWYGWQVFDDIYDCLGLNPGDAFMKWLTEYLKNNGIETSADLLAAFRKQPAGLTVREGISGAIEGLEPRLAFTGLIQMLKIRQSLLGHPCPFPIFSFHFGLIIFLTDLTQGRTGKSLPDLRAHHQKNYFWLTEV